MLRKANQRLPLDEAIQALRRDPTHPVLVKVDEELTVEVRAVEAPAPAKKTLGDLLREIGPWEGETRAELDALFTRQRGNRVEKSRAGRRAGPVSSDSPQGCAIDPVPENSPHVLAIDASSRFVYIDNLGSPTIEVLAIGNSGELSPMAGVTLRGGSATKRRGRRAVKLVVPAAGAGGKRQRNCADHEASAPCT